MTAFFVYRNCDLTDLGVRGVLARTADVVDRAINVIDGDAGVPPDTAPGSDNPELDIITAEWSDPVDGNGTLPPGTYAYDALPIDTCTGRTGTPIALPSLEIATLGHVATLRVQFNELPAGCDAVQIRRDGVVVTPPFPLEGNVPENVTLVDTPSPFGTYSNGTDESFVRVSGADLLADDVVKYNNVGVKLTLVVNGTNVTFAPKIPAELIEPEGFYSPEGRTGFYEASSTMSSAFGIPGFPNVIPLGQWLPEWPANSKIFWPGPLQSFRILNFNPFTGNLPGVQIPAPPWVDNGGPIDQAIQDFIDLLPDPIPFLSDIQAGDIISYGSKTGLVVYVERDIFTSYLPPIFTNTGPAPQFGTVLVIPFGILPIPPFPAGQFWIVYRPEKLFTFGVYASCYQDKTPPNGAPANLDNLQPNIAAPAIMNEVPGFTGYFDNFNSGYLPPPLPAPPVQLPGGPLFARGYETFAEDFLEAGPIPGSPFSQPVTNEPINPHNRLNAFRVFGNGEIDPFTLPPTLQVGVGPPSVLKPGQQILIDGTVVTVVQVTEIIPPGFDKDGNVQVDAFGAPLLPYYGEYEVEFTPPLLDPLSVFPPVQFSRPVSGVGPWVTIPSFVSPYLKLPVIAPTGTYERLTRRVVIRNETSTWQWVEDGAYQDRAGTVDGGDAAVALDAVFVQNDYPGGLPGLLETVRGSRDTTVSDVFVVTNGLLTQIGNRLISVNTLANDGNGTLINLSKIRELRDELCGSVSKLFDTNTEVEANGVAVFRLESREVQVPAARCPPGKPDAREIQLFCLGVATASSPLRAGEVARVYWYPRAETRQGIKSKLKKLGLNAAEIDGALSRTPTDRVLTVQDLAIDDIQDIADLRDTGPAADIDDLLNEPRITAINTGKITRPMVQKVIRQRGNAGIVRRFVGTDPTEAAKPGARPIDDFILPMHRFASLAFRFNESFDLCDYDAAIASIADPVLQARIAAVFAIVEGNINQLLKAGLTLTDFLDGTAGFQEALDAISGIVSGSDGDPTLACLVGTLGTGAATPGLSLPTLPATLLAVSGFIGSYSDNFITRFNLSALFAQGLSASLCAVGSLISTVYGYFGGDVNNSLLQRAIGCLPSIQDLQQAGIEFPSLEAQIAFECSLDQLNIFLDIIAALIAEANEVADFGNAFKTGFAMDLVQARSRQCTSDQGIESLVNGFRLFIGQGVI